MNTRIVVFTTFRSFDGGVNDRIQREFLESLRTQTNQQYTLAVTIFREQGVPEALKEAGVPHRLYHADPGPYKFSWTQALLNGITTLREDAGDILVWISSDAVMRPDFLERIAARYEPRLCGISYPQTSYATIEKFRQREDFVYGWYGFDMVFFSADLFDDTVVEAIKRYPNNDWLYFEIFLAAIGIAFAKRRINLFPSCYSTITNDYAALNQTYHSTKQTGLKNRDSLERFAREFHLPDKDFYQYLRYYTLVGTSLEAWPMRFRIMFHVWYAESYLRRVLPKAKRMLREYARAPKQLGKKILNGIPERLVQALIAHRSAGVLSYAQSGEDIVLAHHVFRNRTTGFYVDVGAHHPRTFSNTHLLYQEGWSGINIDPIPGMKDAFRERTRDVNIQAGVSDKQQTLLYYLFAKSSLNTFNEHLAKERSTEFGEPKKIPIPVYPLKDLLTKYASGKTINLLNIDVEGYELPILRSHDWKKFPPEIIAIEDYEMDPAASNINAYLAKKGYVLFNKMNYTALYRKA